MYGTIYKLFNIKVAYIAGVFIFVALGRSRVRADLRADPR